jgi:hypothetical protein
MYSQSILDSNCQGKQLQKSAAPEAALQLWKDHGPLRGDTRQAVQQQTRLSHPYPASLTVSTCLASKAP